jgi:hypothetical protein
VCPAAAKSPAGNRSISNRVYVLKNVQALLATGGEIYVQNLDADDDINQLGWDLSDVRNLLLRLHDGCYHKSEWCLTGNNHWLDCDSYVINYDDESGIEDSRFPEYYVKFGFANNIAVCGIVSCHLS